MKTFGSLKRDCSYRLLPGRSGVRRTVFISHSSRDRDQAALLVGLIRAAFCLPSSAIRCTSLEGYRLACRAGTDETLKKEVMGCGVLIAMVSESSRQKGIKLSK